MSMMLIDQTKDSACKTAEADAIRAKTGGSAQVAYDWENNKGFADAIDAIPTGITPSGTLPITDNGTYDVTQFASAEVNVQSGGGGVTVDDFVAGTWPSGDITIAVNAGRAGPFYGVSGIRKVTMTVSGDTTIQANFLRASGVTEFVGLELTGIKGGNFFYGCTSLAKVTIPKATYFENNMCYDCGNLLVADIGGGAINRGGVFLNCKKLQTIIIRGTTVCTLGNVSNLSQTPFYPNSGTGITGTGTLYVPSSLVASYKTASNWSTLFNAGTMAVQSIEGSIYENDYADGTPIT